MENISLIRDDELEIILYYGIEIKSPFIPIGENELYSDYMARRELLTDPVIVLDGSLCSSVVNDPVFSSKEKIGSGRLGTTKDVGQRRYLYFWRTSGHRGSTSVSNAVIQRVQTESAIHFEKWNSVCRKLGMEETQPGWGATWVQKQKPYDFD
jgi:hypothetical protein